MLTRWQSRVVTYKKPITGQWPPCTDHATRSFISIQLFGRNDAKAETPVLWPPHAKSWLIGKDSDAGSDWGQEEKGMTEDEMAGWHHRLDGCESEWTLGAGDGQGGLACCDSWGRKESDTTEWLNWTELKSSWTQKNHNHTKASYSLITINRELCFPSLKYT